MLARAGALQLADMPPEVVERIVTALPLRDLVHANATARVFRGAPGGRSPVEHALRERARRRGHARALPAALPSGVRTWAEELLGRERVHELACAHACTVACCDAFSAFVDAHGGLHTCGEEESWAEEAEETMYAPCDAMGHPGVPEVLVPTRVASLSAVRVCAVAAGSHHLLALSDAGAVHACGCNGVGQLGLGDGGLRRSFARVRALAGETVVCVASGTAHSLALTAAGCVYSWGHNDSGQLGHDDTETRWEPRRIEGLRGVRLAGVSGGEEHTLLLSTSGGVFSCGCGISGRLGHGDEHDQHTPRRIEALAALHAAHVSAGRAHSLVVDADGRVYSFGAGGWGRLGHGDETVQPVPMRIEALAGVHAVRACAGAGSSVVLGGDGGVHAFGDNRRAVLGLGEEELHSVHHLPARVLALAHARVVGCALSGGHALYVTADGSAHSCGEHTAALGHGMSAVDEPDNVETPTCIAQLPRMRVAPVEF